MTASAPNRHVRVRFAKVGKVKWTSARDLARMWERAFRRIELPLAYTEGFSPRPKVSFGLALPTGCESVAEYLDLELAPDVVVELDALPAALSAALPVGVDVTAVAELEGGAPSLQHAVTSCRWEIEVDGTDLDLASLVATALAATELPVTRERKSKVVTDDIRPAIITLDVGEGMAGTTLSAELATLARGVRPVELLRALSPDLRERRVTRTHQWIERDGARREPLPAATTDAPHVIARAS
ncbi:MAG TPA: TIGR03936 family radical SAM-associated protein [Acidimicrobiales bacterium]|nr:TIGR03936 family radical SAM-associated protein [Acidimicrobiales bacterium]